MITVCLFLNNLISSKWTYTRHIWGTHLFVYYWKKDIGDHRSTHCGPRCDYSLPVLKSWPKKTKHEVVFRWPVHCQLVFCFTQKCKVIIICTSWNAPVITTCLSLLSGLLCLMSNKWNTEVKNIQIQYIFMFLPVVVTRWLIPSFSSSTATQQ